jgi:Sec-independent protein translocase protein TatA
MMTAAQWGVVGVIGTLILGAVTLIYMARSSTRENARLQREATDREIAEAVRLKDAQIALKDAEISRRRDREVELLGDKREMRRRIDELEDQLRSRGTT